MGTRDLSKLFTFRGQVYIDPTAKDGTGGDALGYTDGGIELQTQDQIIREQVEEEGLANVKLFYAGQNAQLILTSRQWDDEVLAARFPNQWDAAKSRIQLPGDRVAGDDMDDEAVRLLIIPDDLTKDPHIYARKAILVADQAEPMRFRTTESRRVSLVFELKPDETVSSGAADDQYKYRTLVVAKNADWTYGP